MTFIQGYSCSLNVAVSCDFARGQCYARNVSQYLFFYFLHKIIYASFKTHQ